MMRDGRAWIVRSRDGESIAWVGLYSDFRSAEQEALKWRADGLTVKTAAIDLRTIEITESWETGPDA